MIATPPFDTLRLSHSLRDKAHFTQEQSEGFTEALAEAFEDQLATKSDLASLRTELQLLEQRLTIKLGALGAAIVGILAAMKWI